MGTDEDKGGAGLHPARGSYMDVDSFNKYLRGYSLQREHRGNDAERDRCHPALVKLMLRQGQEQTSPVAQGDKGLEDEARQGVGLNWGGGSGCFSEQRPDGKETGGVPPALYQPCQGGRPVPEGLVKELRVRGGLRRAQGPAARVEGGRI